LKSRHICMLDALNTSDRATVVGLNTSNELQGRLMGMGLTVGAKVEVLQGGGHGRSKPLLIGVGEGRIAIGRDIAQMVLVETERQGVPAAAAESRKAGITKGQP
ncbi:MAG: ferrous iron transport protein A, partial [Planctomycetaceae bacterium]|nr:ferrous iron transport protein A [Planctomycetaceae bacterium]